MIDGAVVLRADGVYDRKGPFIPLLYHHGDAGIELRKDRGYLAATMDVAKAHGMHGFRWWLALKPPFWEDFSLTHNDLEQMQQLARDRGLKLLLDGGDQFDHPRDVRDQIRRIILEAGDREVIMSVRGANEGNRHRIDPKEFADWLRPIAEKWPDLMIGGTTGGAGHETGHNELSQPPSNIVGKHGKRDDGPVNVIRHEFSWVYEENEHKDKPRTRITIDDEPWGVSDFVSGMSDHERSEVTPNTLGLAFAMSNIVRTIYVAFFGIELRTQPLSDFSAHMRKLQEVAAWLPADLYSYDDLEHGGPTQGKRVFEVTDPDRKRARADHALKGREKYVVACYDDIGHAGYKQIRGTEESKLTLAPHGLLSKGRQ